MTNQEFEDYKIKIIKIVEIFFPHAKIFLFGSYARGDYSTQSDIDIVDLNAVPTDLKENIHKERHRVEICYFFSLRIFS